MTRSKKHATAIASKPATQGGSQSNAQAEEGEEFNFAAAGADESSSDIDDHLLTQAGTQQTGKTANDIQTLFKEITISNSEKRNACTIARKPLFNVLALCAHI